MANILGSYLAGVDANQKQQGIDINAAADARAQDKYDNYDKYANDISLTGKRRENDDAEYQADVRRRAAADWVARNQPRGLQGPQAVGAVPPPTQAAPASDAEDVDPQTRAAGMGLPAGAPPQQQAAPAQATGLSQPTAPSPFEAQRSMYGHAIEGALAAGKYDDAQKFQDALHGINRQDIDARVSQMTPTELQQHAASVNVDGSHLIMVGGKGESKNGKTAFRTTKADGTPYGPTVELDDNELRTAVQGKLYGEAGYGKEGLAKLAEAHTAFGAHVAQHNETMKNTAAANSAQTTADAAAKNADTTAAYRGAEIKSIQEQQARRSQAADLLTKLNEMSPEDAAGAPGNKLRTQINALNMKDGAQLAFPHTGSSASASLKYQTDNIWADAERKLMGEGASPAAIEQQRQGFYERRGFAPEANMQIIAEGRDIKTGKPLSESDVDAFNRRYPGTPVDKTKLPWLNKATSSAATAATKSAAPATAAPAATGLRAQRDAAITAYEKSRSYEDLQRLNAINAQMPTPRRGMVTQGQ